MLSLLAPPKPTPFIFHPIKSRGAIKTTPINSSFSKRPSSPPPSPPGQVYQPYRPPPAPLPSKYRSLNPIERLDILRDRLGLWHEYAPLITSLSNDGFTPPSIEEVTGITGVHQNRLAVAARVRDSLLDPNVFDQNLIPFFDAGDGADILYELRLLNTSQRAKAATYVVHSNLDAKASVELARSIKDFPRRIGDYGWESFDKESPADCLSFTYFRLSRESLAITDKIMWLEKSLEVAESENAKKKVEHELQKVTGNGNGAMEDEETAIRTRLPVVRLRYGEVAEAASVAMLPVCKAIDGTSGIKEAPETCKWVNRELGVVETEKGWSRWVVLPGWSPVLGLGGEGGVAVEFVDARVLPWRVNEWARDEGVVVVVDRKRKEVEGDDDGFYMVSNEKGELKVVRGGKVTEIGVKEVLGNVVLVVRPPKEDDDQIRDEDWD